MLAPEFLNRIIEKLELKKPCQAGYEQIGMKMKDGKKVPNCVPIEAKEELSSQKVELARKAPSVAKDFERLDDKLRKAESKIDSVFMSYRKAWQDFQGVIKDVAQDRNKLEGDVKEIAQAAMDLGVSPGDVKGLKEAQDLSRKLDGLVKNLPRLYQEPK